MPRRPVETSLSGRDVRRWMTRNGVSITEMSFIFRVGKATVIRWRAKGVSELVAYAFAAYQEGLKPHREAE